MVGPDNPITRAETAEIIYRLLEAGMYARALQSPFPDVGQDEWYTQSVSYLANIGILKGYLDGTFRPGNTITRAEFATIISAINELPQTKRNAFPDVEGHWAVGYINSVAEKGWVSGYPGGAFMPENNLTRAEAVSVLNRMLNRRIETQDIPAWASGFDDLPADHWAYAAIIEASYGHEFERKPNGFELWIKEQD